MATTKQAQTAFEDAQGVVTEWEDKARAARSEAAELEADAGAAILADPTAADEIATRIHARQMTARTYDQAAAEARKQLSAARRELVQAWADEYDRRAKAAEKKLEKHNAAIDALVEQIRELDGGHPWTLQAKEARDPIYGSETIVTSKAAIMADEVAAARNAAEHCRYVLAHGRFVNIPGPLYFSPRPVEPFDVIGAPPWDDAPQPPARVEQPPAPTRGAVDGPVATDDHEYQLDPELDADLIKLGAR